MPKTATRPAAKKPLIKGTYGTMYFVKDMKKSVDWFKSKLGVKPDFASEQWTEFPLGGHSLCLHQADPKHNQAANGTLILHVEGIREMVSRIKSVGAKATEPREIHPGALGAEITDPDGNVLSLYEGPKGC